MTTIPITVTLNLPLEVIEKYLPKILEEQTDLDEIVQSFKDEKMEKMLNSLNLPEEAKTRIRKLKDDYDQGQQPDMNEIFSLMGQYKEEFASVDINQVLSLFKKKEEEKKEFDFSQVLNSFGPILNQFSNQQRGRGKRRH